MKAIKAAQQILQHANAAGLSPKDWADKFNKFNPKRPIDPMTFNPDALVPPEDILNRIVYDMGYNEVGIAHYFTRWGARQAVEALRHQWPEPITDRPPTKEDGDECGFVQVFFSGRWFFAVWENAAKDQRPAWLHTPRWRPKPEPTPKQRAISILYDADVPIFSDNTRMEITYEQVRALRAAVALIPDAPDTTP